MADLPTHSGAPAVAPGYAASRLIRADHATVQKQNVNWLSRRFGFQHQLTTFLEARGGKMLGLEESPLNRLPNWHRWSTLLQRAVMTRDPDARRRILASLGFRLFRRPPIEVVIQPILALDSNAIDEDAYQAWIAHYDVPSPADRVLFEAIAASGLLPEIAVCVRFDAASAGRIGPVVEALTGQIHRGWRAFLELGTDIGAPAAAAIEAAVGTETRVRVTRAEAASDPAWDSWVVVMDPDVVLRPETLLVFAEVARRSADARLIYADEDRVDVSGRRHSPEFKPCFSPELSRRLDYLGACVCVRAEMLARTPVVGRVVAWVQRVAEGVLAAEVVRVPRVLFHVRGDAVPRARRVAEPAGSPSVAIIIPTRNLGTLLEACVDSIWQKTAYSAEKLRIIVVDNGSDEPETLALLDRWRRDERVSIIPDPRPFNYARLNNVAAAASTADVLVFLNNDTEVSDPEWLAKMAGWAARAEIGVVGPKLLYPDRSVQHGGVVLGIGGVAGHSFIGLGADSPGYMGLADVTREAAALTGACIAVRRSVFEELGGFDETLEIAFNDTALCCEAMRRGYRNLYIGDTSVIHHESKSRGFDDTPEKLARFRRECLMVRAPYKDLFDADPYYSPNLGLERQYQPAIPRVPRVWRAYRRALDPKPRVLILSDVHAIGHGVPVVIKEHAEYLARQGWTVFIGGPLQANEIVYHGCARVYLEGQLEAQSFAYESDVDCVIAHTIPYFSIFRTMGSFPRRVVFDHGEPPPGWFPDHRDRENIDAEKQFCYRLAELVLTNTSTVKEEIGYPQAEVAGLGNSHLAVWNPALALRRPGIRAALGFEGKFVVLNVCRFHKAERQYKGVDAYAMLQSTLVAEQPALAQRVVFVLCGKGKDEDIAEMTAQGLTVLANVSDEMLIDLYAAADLYVNFSKWEGFNLGIAQALAMGLAVVASDIAAHRQFPIQTTDDEAARVQLVSDAMARREAAPEVAREPILLPWEPLLVWLEARLSALCVEAD